MVDVKRIQRLFNKHFESWSKHVSIDQSTGLVSCSGDVNLRRDFPVSKLPVAFDHVRGHFNCENNQLQSLENAPLRVGLYFSCKNNPLKSLQGLPQHVGALTWVTWHDQLPLLRLLALDNLFVMQDAPDAVKDIMGKYRGQGRNSSLACGAELARAGFKGNARW